MENICFVYTPRVVNIPLLFIRTMNNGPMSGNKKKYSFLRSKG